MDPPPTIDGPSVAAPDALAPVPTTTASHDFPLHELLLAAAEIGLVLEPAGPGCLVDDSDSFAAMRLCRPGYRVRFARPEDVDALVAIEAANWPDEPEMRTARATVEARVAHNPRGNLVLTEDPEDLACDALPPERRPRVKGGVYFQRTASLESASAFSWYEKERARQCAVVSGDDTRVSRESPFSSAQPYAQLLDIHVDQTFSRSLGRAVGNELRAFVLNVSMVTPGVAGVCAVTRTRGYRRASARAAGRLDYEDYVMSDAASRRDRGLFFHVGGGAVVVKPVRDWRPADVENDGKGTLIEYPLRLIAERRWIAARLSVDAADASPARDSQSANRARGNASVDDDAAQAKDKKKKTAKANGAGGDGSEGSDSDESAVVVEVSFASDALVSLEDKE